MVLFASAIDLITLAIAKQTFEGRERKGSNSRERKKRKRGDVGLPPGIYSQVIYVPKTKNLITLAGLSPEDTVLTWNNTASKIDPHKGWRVIGTGTFDCGSTIVEGDDFIAENITFENSAPENFIAGFRPGGGN